MRIATWWGTFAEAVPVLKKSLQASKGTSDAFDLFFLAMCHHRLGDSGKAKDCRERAGRWLEEHRAKLPAEQAAELTEFQAEADTVLSQSPGNPREDR